MAAANERRKRSHDEDLNDFMPLSKRINNLHIDSNDVGGWKSSSSSSSPTHNGNFPPDNNNSINSMNQNHFGAHTSQGVQQHGILIGPGGLSGLVQNTDDNSSNSHGETTSRGQDEDEPMHLGEYNPDLNADENPYYYNKNKLLYDLYVERMRRCVVLHPY